MPCPHVDTPAERTARSLESRLDVAPRQRPRTARRSLTIAWISRRLQIWVAGVAATAAFLLAAGTASAGWDLDLGLHNHLGHDGSKPAQVTLVNNNGRDCWLDLGLDHKVDTAFASPGTAHFYLTAAESPGFSSCLKTGNHVRGLALKVRDVDTAGSNLSSGWYVPNGSPGDFRVNWDSRDGFVFRDALGTWVPRADGQGLICWHIQTASKRIPPGKDSVQGNENPVGNARIETWGDAHCNHSVPTEVRPVEPTTPFDGKLPKFGEKVARLGSPQGVAIPGVSTDLGVRRAADSGDGDETKGDPGIIDLLSTVGVVCPWYAYPGQDEQCNRYGAGDPNNWSIDNLSTDIRDLHVLADASTLTVAPVFVGSSQLTLGPDQGKGTVGLRESVATKHSYSTSTTHGGKLGFRIGWKQAAGVVFVKSEFSQEINGEYNFARTEASADSVGTTRTATLSAEAEPGFTTRLEVYTDERKANYLYAADLDFGKPGVDQNVTTPANVALDQSPARRQPCLGYVVGDQGVRNSLQFIDKQLLDEGYDPNDSSVPADRRAFLEADPYWLAPKTIEVGEGKDKRTVENTCPGFPKNPNFAAAAGFKGTGVGQYASVSYGADDMPAPTVQGCVFRTPVGGTADKTSADRLAVRARPPVLASPWARTVASSSGPCQPVPVGAKDQKTARALDGGRLAGVDPGSLIDLDNPAVRAGDHEVINGSPAEVSPRGSDDIIGPRTGGTIYTNNGALDIVHVGPAATKVIGGAGKNIVYGGKRGDDVLIGGHGAMNDLIGGRGARTVFRESHGTAEMVGGRGQNTFVGDGMRGTMWGGKGPNTFIAKGDTSQLEMTSGPGNELYEIRGPGRPSIVQVPGPGNHSRLWTVHSLVVPQYIKTARAIGGRNVRLVGSPQTTTLIGNRGNDTLVSGEGPERIKGGPGDDTIVFNDENDDVATGGAGADTYKFTGTPETIQRPAGLRAPKHRMAPTITDFAPNKGDRLVLTAKVFGAPILKLRRHFRVVSGNRPRPRVHQPTLLVNTKTGLVTFDRDGTGPISDKVVVILKGKHTIKRGWVKIRRR